MLKSFTTYLLLDKVEKLSGSRRISLHSYLKEDFIEKSLVITVDNTNVISSVYLSSNDYGTVEWHNGYGLMNSHRWENDDDLEELSSIAHHFPALLLDGDVPLDFAVEKIIPDVLNFLLDKKLKEYIESIISERTVSSARSWDEDITRYRKKSNEYILSVEKKKKELPPSAGQSSALKSSVNEFPETKENHGIPLKPGEMISKIKDLFFSETADREHQKKPENEEKVSEKSEVNKTDKTAEDYVKQAEKTVRKIKRSK